MRFLKTLTLNRRAIYDDRLAVTTANGVVMNTTHSLLLPKGTTAQQPSPTQGMIRYNTTTDQFEMYQGGAASTPAAWRSIRFKEPGKIVLDPIGTGDAVETTFKLNIDPYTAYTTYQSGMTWDAAQMAKNLIVIIENVFQIATINYTVVQNPVAGPGAPYAAGTYIVFGTAVPMSKPIYVLHGFDQ